MNPPVTLQLGSFQVHAVDFWLPSVSVKTVGSSCGDHSFRPVTQNYCQWAPAGAASQEAWEGRYQTLQASAEIRAVGAPREPANRAVLRPHCPGWCQDVLVSPGPIGCELIKGLLQRGGERESVWRGGGGKEETWSTFPRFLAHSLFPSFVPQNRRKQNWRVWTFGYF